MLRMANRRRTADEYRRFGQTVGTQLERTGRFIEKYRRRPTDGEVELLGITVAQYRECGAGDDRFGTRRLITE